MPLEGDFECWLLNAQRLRTSPAARPTLPTQYGFANLSSTVSCGPASCPPKPIRALRDLTRYRTLNIGVSFPPAL
jgi:transposase